MVFRGFGWIEWVVGFHACLIAFEQNDLRCARTDVWAVGIARVAHWSGKHTASDKHNVSDKQNASEWNSVHSNPNIVFVCV